MEILFGITKDRSINMETKIIETELETKEKIYDDNNKLKRINKIIFTDKEKQTISREIVIIYDEKHRKEIEVAFQNQFPVEYRYVNTKTKKTIETYLEYTNEFITSYRSTVISQIQNKIKQVTSIWVPAQSKLLVTEIITDKTGKNVLDTKMGAKPATVQYILDLIENWELD